MAFSFLMGLEIDAPQLWRHRRQPLLIFGSNIAAGLLLTLPISIFLIHNLQRSFSLTETLALFITLLIVISNSSSAITVRMCAEVKIAAAEIGRSAIVAALVNDMTCLFIVSLSSTASSEQSMVDHLVGLLLVVPPVLVVGAYSHRALARLLNRLHPRRRNIKFSETILIALSLVVVGGFTDVFGFSRMLTAFVMGICFPREGKTARSLLSEMADLVHNVLLPVYFGLTGAQLDFRFRGAGDLSWVAYAVAVASVGGKVLSTVGVARYLKMKWVEGLTLAIVLNVKGHVDIFVLNIARDRGVSWSSLLVHFFSSMQLHVLFLKHKIYEVSIYYFFTHKNNKYIINIILKY